MPIDLPLEHDMTLVYTLEGAMHPTIKPTTQLRNIGENHDQKRLGGYKDNDELALIVAHVIFLA